MGGDIQDMAPLSVIMVSPLSRSQITTEAVLPQSHISYATLLLNISIIILGDKEGIVNQTFGKKTGLRKLGLDKTIGSIYDSIQKIIS